MTHTNAHALLTVALRVVAVYLMLMVVPAVLALVTMGGGDKRMLALQAAFVVAGLFVWFFADKIAGVGFSSSRAPAFESDIEPKLWLRIGTMLIGVASAVHALTTLAYLGAMKWQLVNSAGYVGDPNLDVASRAQLVSALVELVIGLWLTLGARGFMALIERARFAASRESRTVESDPPDDETRDA